jgi:hypothetical protein
MFRVAIAGEDFDGWRVFWIASIDRKQNESDASLRERQIDHIRRNCGIAFTHLVMTTASR